MKDCPGCSKPLSDRAIVCNGCGWEAPKRSKKAEAFDPLHGTCEHTDRGQRCVAKAPFSMSTLGGGPWFCFDHFPPFTNWSSTRRTPPPGGFESLRTLTRGLRVPQQLDFEGEAERNALQTEDVA